MYALIGHSLRILLADFPPRGCVNLAPAAIETARRDVGFTQPSGDKHLMMVETPKNTFFQVTKDASNIGAIEPIMVDGYRILQVVHLMVPPGWHEDHVASLLYYLVAPLHLRGIGIFFRNLLADI